MIKIAVILAGGQGERMKPVTDHQPKALVPIYGKSILERQIEQLIEIGVKEIFVLAGYLGDQIKKLLDKKNYEIKVICEISDPGLSPEERVIKYFKNFNKDYVLIYCDNFIPDNKTVLSQFNSTDQIKLLVEKRLKGNFSINSKKLEYLGARRDISSPFVELGYIAIRNPNFNSLLNETKSFQKVFEQLSMTKQLSYQELLTGYLSVSNLERYIEQNLCSKVIILDRDGIINHRMPKRQYLSSIDQLNYINENLQIFKKLSKKGYYFIVASNQPGIALGSVSKEFLFELSQKITTDLRLIGVNILAFYYCKHHWDEQCNCRKPKPGLLLSICSDFKLSLQNTTFIGDEDTDIEAANLAGMKSMKFSPSNLELNRLIINNI